MNGVESMLKVLLVDDDYQVIKHLENLIDWNLCGFEIVGFAQDGKMAFKLIKDTSPDIIVTDIVMPGMDGIELIRCVKDAGICLKFIVLSFYSEHTYVREAMKLGAMEYLIKDEINPSVMLNVLNYVKSAIERESTEEDSRKKEREIVNKSIELLRQETVKNLLMGDYKSYEAVIQEFKRLGINNSFNSAVVACFEIDKSINMSSQFFETSKDLIDHNILEYVSGILSTGSTAEVCKMEVNTYACIITFNKVNSEMYRINKLFTDFSNIIRYVGEKYSMTISVGVSSLCCNLVEIPEYYKKSIMALKLKKFFKPGKILFYEHFKIPNDEMVARETKKIISQIYAEINTQIDFENIRKILKEVSSNIKPDRISLENANQVILELILIFSLLAGKMEELTQKKSQKNFLLVSSIQYGDFFKDFFELIEKKLKKYEEEIKEYGFFRKETRWEIKETIDYISNNYNKKVSLEKIAEKIGMSKTYLSKLFKKEMGVNIENFLLEYRMRIARELLRTSNLKIYEIAINLGFCSTQHFSHIFKKYQGMTPEAFKMNPPKELITPCHSVRPSQ